MHLNIDDLAVPECYRLLIGCVVPRPIAFVTTASPQGAVNLAPFSFFNGVGSNPMTLLFCPANKLDGSEKDTLRNAKLDTEGGTGEFVVNVATEGLARQVAAAARISNTARASSSWSGCRPPPAGWSRRRGSPSRRWRSNASPLR